MNVITVPAGLPGIRAGGAADATRVTVAGLGLLVAFAGVEHGIGEIGQGPVAPPAMVFRSWEGTPAFGPVNGEPAMSVVPNLLVTGILAIVVALAVGGWAVRYAGRAHGALVLAALSVLLVLVGGGLAPLLVGLLAAAAASRIGAVTAAPSGPVSRALARLWPWPLVATVASFLALVPGTVLLYLAAGVDSPALVAALTAAAFAGAVLAVFAARARDRQRATSA